jgi:sterol desaturase/sphingolipid hydroxylase (fatty acid hydroxylase superfamily)
MGTSKIPTWASGLVVAVTFGALLWLEARRPLRRRVEPKPRRDLRNLAVAAAGAVALHCAERPVVEPLALHVQQRGVGLLQRLRLPRWLEVPAAIALMDYTLYVWHVLTHRVPFLWRFHAVHHVDLDLDATTALRFHAGELILSVPWRAAQVRLLGVPPLALSVWQTFLFVCILFHHSNVRLPYGLERRLVRILVTPRMHGIHHSIVHRETDSNWSSGLTLWDWLHGTLNLDVPQQAVTIGVPACRRPQDVTLPQLLRLPFRPPPKWWRTRRGGRPVRLRPVRKPALLHP